MNKQKPRAGGAPTKERKYGNNQSHPMPVWNGLLEHRDKIGTAIWEFLWLIDKITVEKDGIGWCLGKTPIKIERIAKDLKEHYNTANLNLSHLEEMGYITRVRIPVGHLIGVRNSQKFGIWKPKSDSQKTVNHSKSDSQETVNQSTGPTGVIHKKQGEGFTKNCESDSQKTVNPIKTLQLTQQETQQEEKDRAAQTAAPATPPPAAVPGRKEPEPAKQAAEPVTAVVVDAVDPGFQLSASAPVRRGDPRFQPFVAFVSAAFERKHHVPPTLRKKDFKSLKDMLAACPATLADLAARYVNFLASTRDYDADKVGGLAHFCTNVDRYITGPTKNYRPQTFGEIKNEITKEGTRKVFERFGYEVPPEFRQELPTSTADVVSVKQIMPPPQMTASAGKLIEMATAALPAQTQPALPKRARLTREIVGQTREMVEKQILVMVLRDNDALDKKPEIRKLEPGHFSYERHQVIFHGMRMMRRDGKPITVATLIEHLNRHGDLQRAGGESYVKSLVDDAPAGQTATGTGR